jgi:hypothetical protein
MPSQENTRRTPEDALAFLYMRHDIILKVDAVQVVTAMIFKDSNRSRFDQVEDPPIVLDSFSS